MNGDSNYGEALFTDLLVDPSFFMASDLILVAEEEQ